MKKIATNPAIVIGALAAIYLAISGAVAGTVPWEATLPLIAGIVIRDFVSPALLQGWLAKNIVWVGLGVSALAVVGQAIDGTITWQAVAPVVGALVIKATTYQTPSLIGNVPTPFPAE